MLSFNIVAFFVAMMKKRKEKKKFFLENYSGRNVYLWFYQRIKVFDNVKRMIKIKRVDKIKKKKIMIMTIYLFLRFYDRGWELILQWLNRFEKRKRINSKIL